jgi:hypothetical protein
VATPWSSSTTATRSAATSSSSAPAAAHAPGISGWTRAASASASAVSSPSTKHCRAADGVWGIGDVTAVMPFTHVAKYQGRIVADAILGRARPATYDGIPRVVFAEPEIAAAGLTRAQADEQRLRTTASEIDLAQSLARPWTYERDPRGHLGLLADVDRGVLLGACAVAPQLAIKPLRCCHAAFLIAG